jgi:hypothetical protein
MKKKRIKWVVVVLFFVVFLKLAMLMGDYTSSEENEGLAVKLNIDGDFPNPKEGSAVFNTRLFMDNIIKVHNKVPKYVIFTESKKIPGLILRYNIHDSVFEGGLPLLKSKEVVFLDGNMHEVIYTFREGEEQKFYFDGEKIASGIFDSSDIGITGFAVSELEGYEIGIIGLDGSAEFK